MPLITGKKSKDMSTSAGFCVLDKVVVDSKSKLSWQIEEVSWHVWVLLENVVSTLRFVHCHETQPFRVISIGL